MTSFNLLPPESPSLNTVTLEIKVQHTVLGGHNSVHNTWCSMWLL